MAVRSLQHREVHAGSPSFVAAPIRPPFRSGRSRGIIPARWAVAWRARSSSAALRSRCVNDGTRVLAGACVPVGDGALPYAPIVEAMRALASDVGVGAVRE